MNFLKRLYKGRRLTGRIAAAMSAVVLLSNLSSCHSRNIHEDEPEIPGQVVTPEDNSAYYIALNVTTPTERSTRGTTDVNGNTSSDGTIPGTTKESTMTSAVIYLCVGNEVKLTLDASNNNLAIAEGSTTGEYQLTAKIRDLRDLLSLAGKRVQIVVAGNVSESGITYSFNTPTGGKDNVSKATFTISDATTAPAGDFGDDNTGKVLPLVNANNYTVTMPNAGANDDETLAAIKTLFTKIIDSDAWWEMRETLELERAVARFEYRGVMIPPAEADENDQQRAAASYVESNVYDITSTNNVKIRLNTLQPFNVNKTSYLFRHGAAGDLTKATAASDSVFLEENGGNDAYNWVATPDWIRTTTPWSKDDTYLLNKLDFGESAYSIPNNTNGLITMETLGGRDVTEAYDAATQKGGYHPWCYVTENTLPNIDLMAETTTNGETEEPMRAKNATGVLFTFRVLGTDGNDLKYSENRTNYPSDVTNSKENPGHIVITDKDNNWMELAPDSEDCFNLTYIACILHNDAAATGSNAFAPMKYGVVRNNTYQMSVTGISSLPFPEEPKTMYLGLEIKVLAWAKRDIVVGW